MPFDYRLSLVKEEVEAVLHSLADESDFYKLVREPLSASQRILAEGAGQPFVLSLLPLDICESISGTFEPAIPVAAALQFFLAAGDVYDDIEDNDSAISMAAKYGNSVATNIAATLLILAEKSISRISTKNSGPNILGQVLDRLNSFYTQACLGQHLDLLHSSSQALTEDEYLKIISLKSASQIEGICYAGALCGGAGLETIEIFSGFGHNLGIVSQLTNDISGVSEGKDILKRKMTLPVIFAFSQSEGADLRVLKSYYQRPQVNEIGVETIKEILYRTGAVYYTNVKIEYYKQIAREYISRAEASGIKTDKFKMLVA